MRISIFMSKASGWLSQCNSFANRRSMAVALALYVSSIPLTAAQSCSVPLLTPMLNVPVHINTCASSYLPNTFCGGIVPTGTAVVFNLYMAYPNPATTLLVEPDNANYDVAFVIESRQCSDLSICPYAIDAAGPGGTEQLNLGDIDSGQYYLVITSFAPTQTCGGATVLLSNPEDFNPDGLFRARQEY